MDKLLKPIPEPSAMSRPYWDAAAQGRLILQSCAECGRVRHYPQLLCSHCYSDAVIWKDASGRGTVHSWTVAHHAFHPAFAADLPYTLVTVDLEEGVRALGLWQSDVKLSLGLPVHGQFEPREESVAPIFRPIVNPDKYSA
jgi:uncharacterized OB-fold protein